MKIYCSRRNDMTTLTTLQKFAGKELWFKVTSKYTNTSSEEFTVYHRISAIYNLMIGYNEICDIFSPYHTGQTEEDLEDMYTISYSNYIQRYAIDRPLQVYTTDEVKEFLVRK